MMRRSLESRRGLARGSETKRRWRRARGDWEGEWINTRAHSSRDLSRVLDACVKTLLCVWNERQTVNSALSAFHFYSDMATYSSSISPFCDLSAALFVFNPSQRIPTGWMQLEHIRRWEGWHFGDNVNDTRCSPVIAASSLLLLPVNSLCPLTLDPKRVGGSNWTLCLKYP